MTPNWTVRPWPLPPAGEEVAAQLEAAADLIDASPGLNVLDAFRQAHQAAGATELVVSQTYYALLEYLPPEVEYLAPWSDRETSDRVAMKLRQLARTVRKGGPARIGAVPTGGPVIPELDSAARNRVEHPKPGKGGPNTRQPGPDAPREAHLRYEAGRIRTRLGRVQSGQHPDQAKITRLGDRLAAIQAELDQLAAAAADSSPSPAPRPLAGSVLGRRPGTESGL